MLQTTGPVPALVLLSCGTPHQIGALQAAAAPPLAQTLQRQLASALPATPAPQAHGALAALAAGTLVPVPQDPGQTTADGCHWAELLGAWRQPSLLLISADQLDSGVAAATTALLQQWQVPLLGLVQWQGSWDQQARLADQLPWLGCLGGPEAQADAVALAAARRTQQLQAQLL
ncbi:MAG: hypothetical protein RLZZ336_809 [Cyanobacteriota bacterium]